MSPIPERKKAQRELANNLYERLASFEVQSFLDLLRSLRSDALEAMVDCEDVRVKEHQGRVKALDELIRLITRPPLRGN